MAELPGLLLPPPLHPFPARMAPEIAMKFCRSLPRDALVLDPMVGSGTTLRAAIDSGHFAVGVDMDPLAVLLSRAWTTPISAVTFLSRANEVARRSKELLDSDVRLPWIDDDPETSAFVQRWFGRSQISGLRAISAVLHGRRGASWDLCRVALSRIIITKDRGASLARDVSHSRPHVVYLDSDYDVFEGYARAVALIAKRIDAHPPARRASVLLGDARTIRFEDSSVDAVITSPPYLNAIDYLRGHRMALVWLGFSLGELRGIRGAEVGAERVNVVDDEYCVSTASRMGEVDRLTSRTQGMIRRYASDMRGVMGNISKCIKPSGSALVVVGNSSLNKVFLRNDVAVEIAGISAGMELVSKVERELPPNRRYLPPPRSGTGALHERMRAEVVMSFRKL